MTRTILLTFFPEHPSNFVEDIDEMQLRQIHVPRNKRLYYHKETREKVFCTIETLEPLYREMEYIPSIFISEALIPTGIFNVDDLNMFIENESKAIDIDYLNTLDMIRKVILDNRGTIVALHYIKEHLIHNNMPFVEIKFV